MTFSEKRVFLFDVDGTLTKPRQRMSQDIAQALFSLSQEAPVYLITGSDYDKMVEQIDQVILCDVTGVYTCAGNVFTAENRTVFSRPVRAWEPAGLDDLLVGLVESGVYPIESMEFLADEKSMPAQTRITGPR